MTIQVRTPDGNLGIPVSTNTRLLTADQACVIAASDHYIQLNSAAGAKTITMTATYPGHIVRINSVTVSGGSYTAAVVGGVVVTFDAANESAEIIFDGTLWNRLTLLGATLV